MAAKNIGAMKFSFNWNFQKGYNGLLHPFVTLLWFYIYCCLYQLIWGEKQLNFMHKFDFKVFHTIIFIKNKSSDCFKRQAMNKKKSHRKAVDGNANLYFLIFSSILYFSFVIYPSRLKDINDVTCSSRVVVC